ncbi:hypothetical protein GQR58_019030 [Nymphon striatum]|nr:hypothetical protein GQR58_019030 [Nymphon striatum]
MAGESTKLMKNPHLLDFWIYLAFLKEKSYYAARNKQQLIRDLFLAEASKKQSTNYNVRNKVADASFMVGETVYWKRPPPAVTGSKKWLPVWQGPFTICGQLGPKTYIIEGDNGIKTTVNIDQLKKSQVKDKIVVSFSVRNQSFYITPWLIITLLLCIEGGADINLPSRKKEDDSSTSLLLAARVKHTLRLLQNLQNGRDEAFSKLNIDNRKLLWHGTKLENVIGILSQELEVAPINAQLCRAEQRSSRGCENDEPSQCDTTSGNALHLTLDHGTKSLLGLPTLEQPTYSWPRTCQLKMFLKILLEDLNCDPNAVEKCEDSTSLDTWNNSLHILASRGIFYALCRETSSFQPCSPNPASMSQKDFVLSPVPMKSDDVLSEYLQYFSSIVDCNAWDDAKAAAYLRPLLGVGSHWQSVRVGGSMLWWVRHILASRGIFYALPILLKFKSDPNAYNKEGRTPMLCAIANHYSIKELIEGGADINLPSRKKEDDSSTSLLLAARVKHTLRLLQNLQNGRDEAFSKLNIDNRKLLWYGTKLENVIGILSQELRILLEDLNCDPNAVEKSEDSTSLDTWNNSLHILASRGIFYALPILLKFKSDPNAYNKEGRTPMLCAIANHYSIKELIEGGADINLPSRKKEDDSSTSLLLAARVKHTLRLLQNLQNGRNKAFSKLNIDNRKLLWHGTKLENVIGILSQELRVAPINAQL